MREGWYRGMLDGSRPWIVIFGASVLGRLATRALKREYEVLWSGEVKPGQVVTVRNGEVEPEAAVTDHNGTDTQETGP
jgi:hypothetical protein